MNHKQTSIVTLGSVIAVFGAAVLAAPVAEAQVIITSSTALTSDISCTTSPCVEIAADNITVDGRRRTVDCNGFSGCVSIFQQTGVTLFNLKVVEATGSAIRAGESPATTLRGVTVVGGQTGIDVQNSMGSTVESSSVSDASRAISIFMSPGSDVTGNTIQRFMSSDVEISTSDSVTVDGNTVKGQSVGSGIDFNNSNSVLVTGNRVTSASVGIGVYGNSSEVAGNTLSRSSNFGIDVVGTSNFIHDNVATRSLQLDIFERNGATCDSNTYLQNRFKTTNAACVQ